MGAEWAEKRRAAGLAHRKVYDNGGSVYDHELGQPRCRLCRGGIEGMLVSVNGVSVGSAYYHELCYERRWSSILDQLG